MGVRDVQGARVEEQLRQQVLCTFLRHLCVTALSPPGYMVFFVVLLFMLVLIFLMVFNFWWLSYWLEQGSGVSILMGVGHVSVGLHGVGRFL